MYSLKLLCMKFKQFYYLVFLFFLAFSLQTNAQEFWEKVPTEMYYQQKKEVRTFKNFPEKYTIFSLNVNGLENQLKSAVKQIKLPNANGILESFEIKESFTLAKSLADKFPNIKSYSAKGIDNPTAFAKISLGSDGFHAVIFYSNGKTVYVDPYSKNNKDFIVYNTSDLKSEDEVFKCGVEEVVSKQSFPSFSSRAVNDGNLRTFRIAIACSGEYAQFHLTNQSVSTTASETVKKAAVLSAMHTSMTRVNGIFEKDLAVTMQIVADNEKIIFLDATTDNITDGDPDEMIDEVQSIIDNQIGNANYDLGHIFSIGGDGLAGLGVVCIVGQKARGVTGRSSPIGDPYDIDFVAHELGHQFGATHTQNNNCNRTSSTAVEPGSASTLMGYGGICSPNVQGQSDDYFHAVSITQMQNIIQSSGGCATLTSNGNSAPVADAGLDYSIPKSTPFVLKGVATDADGLSTLTYNWEQVDNETGTMPPLPINTGGPMFRSLPSKTVPERYFPEYSSVISGDNGSTWEVLPSVERSLNFSLLVRDNNTSGGATSRDNMLVSVTDAIPFEVTSQNTNVTWNAGSSQTITWSKGTSDVAPINCKTVNIKLSEDNGLTFPITLKANTLNDGSETIIVPNNITARARILVEAADNIFYNVNSTNFTIQSTEPTFILTNTSGDLAACNTGNQSVAYTLKLDFINGFTETVSFTATDQPAGSNVVFSPTSISNDGEVVMTVSNLDGVTAQDFTINIAGSSSTVNQNLEVNLAVTASSLAAVSLASPANGASKIALTESLIWQEDTNATSYNIQVATDVAFSNIIIDENIETTTFELFNLQGETTYFWRVKSKNSCNESSFSSVFSFTTEAPVYCASTFTDEIGGTEHITNVTFNGINNNSDNDIVDGYQDFTDINTNVLRGQTREISVTFDTGGFQDHCYVFIDWNQDYIFDKDTERYDLGTKLEDIATATLNITVPSDARFGKTRMRVIIEYDDPSDGFGDGPCDSDHKTEWGETEDYSVTVLEPTLRPNNYTVTKVDETDFNANDGTINIALLQEEFSYEVTITGPSSTITETIVGNSFQINNLPFGAYQVCIKAIEINDTQCFTVEIVQGKINIDPDNFTIKTTSETCLNENDGVIDISVKQQQYSYQLTIVGPSTNINAPLTNFRYSLSDLAPGVYTVCILINESNQTNCYEVSIDASEQISLKATTVKNSRKYSFTVDKGTAPYNVYLNDKLLITTSEKTFEITPKEGGKLEVKSAKDCEGVYKTTIETILLLKNPLVNSIDILLPLGTIQNTMEATIFNMNGKLVFKERVNIKDNTMSIPFENYAKGVYILKLPIDTKPIKIIKQ